MHVFFRQRLRVFALILTPHSRSSSQLKCSRVRGEITLDYSREFSSKSLDLPRRVYTLRVLGILKQSEVQKCYHDSRVFGTS